MTQLVLSLFPGIGLLDMAFEAEGFCVVRGPDTLWGGDIRRFHPPAGKFDGVIGGPPCQAFSKLRHIVLAKGQTLRPNLIPEFERVITATQPQWFLMENVPDAPEPSIHNYITRSYQLNNRWFGAEQNRERRFSFGALLPEFLTEMPPLVFDFAALEHVNYERAVVATSSKEGALAKSQQELACGTSPRMAAMKRRRTLPGQQPRRTIARCAELQGLPKDFLVDAPFTAAGKYEVVGNGVPLPMGRAVARAVRRALGLDDAKAQT